MSDYTPSDSHTLDDLQQIALTLIAEVMDIERQLYPEWDELSREDRAIMIQGEVDHVLTVEGQLTQESTSAYHMLDTQLSAHNMTPLFRERFVDGKAKHIIHILDGRIKTPRIGNITQTKYASRIVAWIPLCHQFITYSRWS